MPERGWALPFLYRHIVQRNGVVLQSSLNPKVAYLWTYSILDMKCKV